MTQPTNPIGISSFDVLPVDEMKRKVEVSIELTRRLLPAENEWLGAQLDGPKARFVIERIDRRSIETIEPIEPAVVYEFAEWISRLLHELPDAANRSQAALDQRTQFIDDLRQKLNSTLVDKP